MKEHKKIVEIGIRSPGRYEREKKGFGSESKIAGDVGNELLLESGDMPDVGGGASDDWA